MHIHIHIHMHIHIHSIYTHSPTREANKTIILFYTYACTDTYHTYTQPYQKGQRDQPDFSASLGGEGETDRTWWDSGGAGEASAPPLVVKNWGLSQV